MYPFYVTISVVVGLMLGSFFNVLIWRLPRHESIVHPGSHCPSCGRPVRPWENVPVLSFIFLGGKCAGCKAAISWRYPLVELMTAACALLLLLALVLPHAGQPHTVWDNLFLAWQVTSLLVLIPLALIDLQHYIIPDAITLPGLAAGLVLSLMPGSVTPAESFLGLLAGGGSLLSLGALGEYVFRKKDAMGGGDIKLMAFLGAVWGWKVALLGIVFGSALGAVACAVLLPMRALPKDRRIPFGPFLAAGTWVAALWGQQILDAYFVFAETLLRGR